MSNILYIYVTVKPFIVSRVTDILLCIYHPIMELLNLIFLVINRDNDANLSGVRISFDVVIRTSGGPFISNSKLKFNLAYLDDVIDGQGDV